ncbi:fungal-specific transcription factor domain-containing protein [Durotheca rogersii]|uniref:fungal-specific transcription factor domain-containing protein n=1 Tax=Durotheca rogersii TaxID=419775 RepID=UPI00221E5D82|nr:fungal-specific transcription factor domain-containing protein [Durotheca rogersii]KAI5868270.1 fungal-specific transcription factor domain-containing protein [Durotheca rogersii]
MCSTHDGYYTFTGDDSPFYSRIFETFCADPPKPRGYDKVVRFQLLPYNPRPANQPGSLSFASDPTSPRTCVQPAIPLPRVPRGQRRTHLSYDPTARKRQHIKPDAAMDVSGILRPVHGFGAYIPRPLLPPSQAKKIAKADHHDGEASHRIAHTLTACCRCRQRKTRCDPTLPRCLPCERSGSVCEYFDTAKNKRISRYYVVKLQEKVRALEAELGQYTDEDDLPKNHEDFLRPGGLVRLNETDETPRYLGPSSGIAMTRILMEEAKRYTDSKRISELIPDVRERRQPHAANFPSTRSQSFAMPPTVSRKKSYPIISAVAAQNLPSKVIADRLIEVFHQRAQVFTPTLHEKALASTLEDVYAGSEDPYKNFVVRLVMATSMQKLDTAYAGLADSYYLAAMKYFEDVVRPKDLKTLQCLVLIGQYSLLTPTRTAVYYIAGLATRICQQLGLADEKTISIGANDPLTLDMRRRLSWIVGTMELGLAHSMGRPNGFAKSDDINDVRFFETVSDANISEAGITPGPPDEKKLVAIHFCKMRQHQAEIRRVLYEKKHPEPADDRDPWFARMEATMDQWLKESPEAPAWCRPWFSGRFHTMMVTLHRPSPQIPRPSVRSATKCFDSAAFVIDMSSKQMMAAAVDITWIFVLTLYMSLNTLLWSVTYPEIRALHSRDEVQELVNISLDIIDQCAERWPGTTAASQLYSTFTKACLQSYESNETPSSSSSFTTPPSQIESGSPSASEISSATTVSKTGAPAFNPPNFSYIFGSGPQEMNNYKVEDNFPFPPTFRSNSIFLNPASSDHTGRRFSYFPPDFTQNGDISMDESSPPDTDSTVSPPFMSPAPQDHLPTPPESMHPGAATTPGMTTPILSTPMLSNSSLAQTPSEMSTPSTITTTPQQQRAQPAAFAIPPPQRENNHNHNHNHQSQAQRPLPQATEWFNPPPPFMSPYGFGGLSGSFWGDASSPPSGVHNHHHHNGFGGDTGANGNGMNGINGIDGINGINGMQFTHGLSPERQGSLSQEQQIELMDVLENEGMTDIDTYLNMSMGMGAAYQDQDQMQNHIMGWGGRS